MNSQPIVISNQQCSVTSLYRPWLAYVAGIATLATLGHPIALGVFIAAAPLAKWAQIRSYRHLSRLFGYGSVEDRAPSTVRATSGTVTLYQAVGCPFCPLVLSRLRALQSRMGFNLDIVDVTLQPKKLARFGIQSVPVVESADRFLLGNATSEQLAELIAPA